MNKKIFKIFLQVIGFLIYFIIINKGLLKIEFLQNNHFNLITVNSIFAGFLFSSLALIVGLSNDKVLKVLERGEYLEAIYNNIIFGIVNSLLSIFLSLFNMFVSPQVLELLESNDAFVYKLFDLYLPSLELFFLISTIVFFILSVKAIQFIIKAIRERIKSEFPDKSDMKNVLSRINKGKYK